MSLINIRRIVIDIKMRLQNVIENVSFVFVCFACIFYS